METKILITEDIENTLVPGDRVKIINTNDFWEGKTGVVQKCYGNGVEVDVLVDFIPSEKKKTIQTFTFDKLKKTDYNESVNKGENKMAVKLNEESTGGFRKEIDWNGHHYEFREEFHRTGAKSHDKLIMTDDKGNEYEGETTWINRPWHRFDLEEAWCTIVDEAFGVKALDVALEVNQTASSIEKAIDGFFAKFKPEDISAPTKEKIDTSEDGKKAALAQYLKADPSEIETESDNEFTYDGETYRVLTDDEADDEFDSSVRSLWDDMGLESVSDYLKDEIIHNCISEDHISDIAEEDAQFRVDDMDDYDVVSEAVEHDLIGSEEAYDEDGDIQEEVDIEDLRDQLQEYYKNETIENFNIDDFGLDAETLKNYIDEDKAIEEIKDEILANNSRGEQLATYDGEEHDLDNGMFAYRID